MTPTRFAARATLAGVTLTALGLFVATPASAHTNNLYTYLGSEEGVSWATLDRTNGNATLLPTGSTYTDEILGAEVFNEVGYAVVEVEAEEGDDFFAIFDWDHTTGADGNIRPLDIPGSEGILRLSGLDTRTDGTLLTYVEYDIFEGGGEFPETHHAIASIDPVSGNVTPLVFLDALLADEELLWAVLSLATDPLSGITYAFLYEGSEGVPYYLPLDVPAGTYSEPVAFAGAGFGGAPVLGADFDGDGSLFFINPADGPYQLSHIGAVSTWPTAEREVRGPIAANIDAGVAALALTLEHTPPALAATGSEFSAAWLVAGVVAVLAGGLAVVSTQRKRRAA